MKKILFGLAAIPAAVMATPAAAQTGYGANGGMGMQNRIQQLEVRLDAGVQAGAIDRSEQRSLRRQIRQLSQMEMQFSANGLTQQERSTLQQRIRSVRDQLRNAYGRGYAWDDSSWDSGNGSAGVRYDQNGRPIANGGVAYDQYGRAIANSGVVYDRDGRPITNNGVVYDQYGRPVANGGVVYDRNGRPVGNSGMAYDQYGRPVTNGYVGQGGTYQQQGSGIGNILGGALGGSGGGIGGILGTILGNGGLRSGDVISNTIGSVLGRGTAYGSQYEDRSNVYFRSDGERVYEIDARTNRVVRIHPIR
jgi:hypothetical protein